MPIIKFSLFFTAINIINGIAKDDYQAKKETKNTKRNKEGIKKKKKRMSVAMEKVAKGDRIG